MKSNKEVKKLILIGASGFGREVAWLVERINHYEKTWELLGFLDDNSEIIGNEVNGYKVLGEVKDAIKYKDSYFVCCIGSSKIRKDIIKSLENLDSEIKFATLIDPSVIKSDTVSISEGSIICAGTILTVNIEIGSHVIINLNTTVGHDTIINDFVTTYPGVNLSGSCIIENTTEIGTNSSIIQGVTIDNDNIVGAGTVIIKNFNSNNTIVGVPGKAIK